MNGNHINDSHVHDSHAKEDHHGHHHVQIDLKKSLFSTIVLTLALGVHAIFEGIVIGLANTSSEFINIVVAVLIHKSAEAIALVQELFLLLGH